MDWPIGALTGKNGGLMLACAARYGWVDLLSKFFYLPTDAQENCFKRILKFTLKMGSVLM